MSLNQEKIAVIGRGYVGLQTMNSSPCPAPLTCHLSPEVLERAAQMRRQMGVIRNAPLPPDDEPPHLPVNYQDRMDAMEFRAQVRLEQSRSV